MWGGGQTQEFYSKTHKSKWVLNGWNFTRTNRYFIDNVGVAWCVTQVLIRTKDKVVFSYKWKVKFIGLKTSLWSVKNTLGFCCYSHTWFGMTSSLWWLMLAHLLYSCATDITESVCWLYHYTYATVFVYIWANSDHRIMATLKQLSHENHQKLKQIQYVVIL